FFVFMTFTFIQREISYSRLFIALSFVSSFFFISSGRFILNRFKRFFYYQGYFLTRALLISDQNSLSYLSQHITRNTGYLLVEKLSLSSLKRLESVVREKFIDEIIIHLPREQQSKLLDIIHRAGYRVAYTLIPHYTNLLTKRITPSSIGSISALKLETSQLHGSNALLKRLFDFFFSLFFIIFLSPLFLFISIFIKLLSPKGHIFYKQERVSYNYKPFQLYKFRTMVPDAESLTGPKWADNNDSRIYPLGKFLRRTNLDELPQLFNVFLGHMSLVGPRPERPFFIQQFKDQLPHYLERHAVKGGMTGWAQVNGYYGNTSLDERIKHDIFYIENWSFFFDIKIILRTFKLIFFRKH
ncbi:MAG: sugar transferase, partial [Candidatus Woesearchaeota archaeon]|nr:sugar transferase [Candidatus Woesearchaeota archaeon]